MIAKINEESNFLGRRNPVKAKTKQVAQTIKPSVSTNRVNSVTDTIIVKMARISPAPR